MYQPTVGVLQVTNDINILQDSTTTVPELFHDPIPKTNEANILLESPPKHFPDNMQLDISTSTTIHRDLKLPHQLLVTPHGLVSQSDSPSSSPEKVEANRQLGIMDTFPYSENGDKSMINSDVNKGDKGGDNLAGNCSQNNISNDFVADINTIVITNDETGEVKMTFSDNGVGQYEEIEEKPEQKELEQGIDDTCLDDIEMVSFTALTEKDKVNGISPVRKSDRSIKLNSVFADGEGKKIPGFGKVLASQLMKQSENTYIQKPKSGSKNGKTKRSRKQTDPKKSKLDVDDVYESDDGEGIESDGDLSKDLLKVRMMKCDVCGKHFLDRQKLQTHKITHNKKKNTQPLSMSSQGRGSKKVYPCEVCGYTFHRREHWRRHRLTHLDVTPYKCPVCDRGFKRAEHVRRHQTVHTGVKAFDCNLCDKKFTRSEHLKKHMLVHIGKTPFPRKKKNDL